MNEDTVIYVVGFVTPGGIGGFEWDTNYDYIESIRQSHLNASEVREYTLSQLQLDGNYTNEAITDALDQWPEAWEPKENQ